MELWLCKLPLVLCILAGCSSVAAEDGKVTFTNLDQVPLDLFYVGKVATSEAAYPRKTQDYDGSESFIGTLQPRQTTSQTFTFGSRFVARGHSPPRGGIGYRCSVDVLGTDPRLRHPFELMVQNMAREGGAHSLELAYPNDKEFLWLDPGKIDIQYSFAEAWYTIRDHTRKPLFKFIMWEPPKKHEL